MKAVLLFDTCGEVGYASVVEVKHAESRVLAERTLAARRTQEELLPAIARVLLEAGIELDGLAAVALTVGPGSFTGVRIGLAVAKGLCEAQNLPLLPVSRLAVLAFAAGQGPRTAWLDAGRGDVYALRVNEEPSDVTALDGALLSRDEALLQADGTRVVVLEPALAALVPDSLLIGDADFRTSLVKAAARALHGTQPPDAALVDALYLRRPDAENARLARPS